MNPSKLCSAIESVVLEDNCSGCGACVHLAPGLAMTRTREGFVRPDVSRLVPLDEEQDARAHREFVRACPGRTVTAHRSASGATRHPVLGPIEGIWEAWAADPQIRFDGSSGGALTALATWLLEEDEISCAIAASADESNPTLTRSVVLKSSAESRLVAGSRYAPTASAAADWASNPRQTALIGKPCEASAVRSLSATSGVDDPLILSFFCAGVPSQHATDELLETLGVTRGDSVVGLRYRGQGWPGDFRVDLLSGRTLSATYDASWGEHLGRALQSRCKICPDGLGESADIVAGDYWEVDARGYPVFDDAPGRGVLIARTLRGRDVIERAIAQEVLVVSPATVDRTLRAQPYQVRRKATLAGRLIGLRLAGLHPPDYLAFGLMRLALLHPLATLRAAAGAYLRGRRRRKSSGLRGGSAE